MKKLLLLCTVMLASGMLTAQDNYSNDVTFVEKSGNTLTLRSAGMHAKKKEAPNMAVKSAFYTLFYNGVEGVNNGKPFISADNPSYTKRFFDEGRYSVFVKSYQETEGTVKQGNQYRSVVTVEIFEDALRKDLIRNKVQTSLSMSAGTPGKGVKLPVVVVVPFAKESEDVREIIENNQMLSLAIGKVKSEFNKRGYVTKDFITLLKALKTGDVLTAGSQSDAVAKVVQNSKAEIEVLTKIFVTNHPGRKCEVSLELQAVEVQTGSSLANATFLSGQYATTDSTRLANHALGKISNEFFTNLQNAFNNIVQNGREVTIQLVLSSGVTEWDFSSPAGNNGDEFQMVMEDWLEQNALNGIYSMNSSDKVVDISMQMPVYDEDRGRAYTTSRLSSELKKFLNDLLRQDGYSVDISTIGQRLTVTVK